MSGEKKENKSTKLMETTAYLLKTRRRLVNFYIGAAKKKDTRRMNYLNRKIQEGNRLLASLGQIETELQQGAAISARFVVSSLFLHDCFQELTVDSKEQFFFITGFEAGGILGLSQRCGFEHVKRTATGVEGDLKSTHGLLCKLEKFGHRLLAHFHSHPGHGIGSTFPSPTDRDFQERLERGGFPTIAAIFSRDGYVRFFRLDQTFTLEIHGSGVEEVEPNVYRLTYIN